MPSCPPILLIVFNRPQLATQVLDAIRRQRPEKLYIAADGPREPATHPNDAERCHDCRRLAESIDWPCEVFTRFSEANQGCGRGPSNAISWFFEHESAGIILEDDCRPGDDFFLYCAELLARYQDHPEVMHICGNNFGSPEAAKACAGLSYGFGRYAQVWGWASCARAWRHFQYDVAPDVENRAHFKVRGTDRLQQKVHQERVRSTLGLRKHDVWDYQWQFAVLKNKGLTICPSVNLISNLGFGEEATHTTKTNSPVAQAATGRLAFPLIHPATIADSPAINRLYADQMLGDAKRHRKKLYKSWLRRITGRAPSRKSSPPNRL